MKQYVKKIILYAVGDNDDVDECHVYRVSPNEKYVLLISEREFSRKSPGWVSVDKVKVLDSWDRPAPRVPNWAKDEKID